MADPVTDMFGIAFTGGGEGLIGGIIGLISALGMWLGIGLVAGVAVFILARMGRYSTSTTIFVRKAGRNLQIINDKMRELVDSQGKPIFECMRTRRGPHRLTLPRVNNKYVYQEQKKGILGGTRTVDRVFLWLDDNQQAHPVRFGIKEQLHAMFDKEARETMKRSQERSAKMLHGLLKPVDMEKPPKELLGFLQPVPHERQAWASMERKRQEEKTKSQDNFKDLMIKAVPVITLVICFLILYFMWQTLGEQLAAATAAWESIAREMGNLLN